VAPSRRGTITRTSAVRRSRRRSIVATTDGRALPMRYLSTDCDRNLPRSCDFTRKSGAGGRT
jgi:hypothetical protein